MLTDARVPNHVPADLVVDIDIYNLPGGDKDPQTAWKKFQGKANLIYTPRNGGHWIATNGPIIASIYRDFRRFSSTEVVIPVPGGVPLLPIQANPPHHKAYRQTIDAIFAPKEVDRLSSDIRQLVIELMDEFIGDGACEFMSQFAVKFPLMIFLKMMGLPTEDLLYLRKLVESYAASPDIDVKRAANAELVDYLSVWINRRTDTPADDGLTAVTKGEIDGRPFSLDEKLSICLNLLGAGLDTVMNMLGFIVRYLAEQPDQRKYIRANGDQMTKIVQEFLRRYPIANMARTVAEDMEYEGVAMKAGEMMYLPTSLYNLDEALIENPEDIDLTRSAPSISFGSGRHTCAGAILARKELGIFLEEWLRRIPDFELDRANAPIVKAGAINAACSVWLKWPLTVQA